MIDKALNSTEAAVANIEDGASTRILVASPLVASHIAGIEQLTE